MHYEILVIHNTAETREAYPALAKLAIQGPRTFVVTPDGGAWPVETFFIQNSIKTFYTKSNTIKVERNENHHNVDGN